MYLVIHFIATALKTTKVSQPVKKYQMTLSTNLYRPNIRMDRF